MSAAVLVRDGEISIHAPVKEATRLHDRHHAECGHFNPRSREGSDMLSVPLVSNTTAYFNPRSREGSDVSAIAAKLIEDGNFNPRSREGSDMCRAVPAGV